jgi:hypothetical protein
MTETWTVWKVRLKVVVFGYGGGCGFALITEIGLLLQWTWWGFTTRGRWGVALHYTASILSPSV